MMPLRRKWATSVRSPLPHKTALRLLSLYSGPSSNHFMFRSLSEVFVEASQLFGAKETQVQDPESSSPERRISEDAPTHTDLRKPVEQEHVPQGTGLFHTLPQYQDAILLINHYFATVGFVLPYVEKPTLVSQYLKTNNESPPKVRRSFFALVSIICALSLSSLGDDRAEVHYQRALSVLTPHCLRGSSLELG